jgi:hypothetical protein
MEAQPIWRPLRARLFVGGSIEVEVAVAGVALPVKLAIARSVQRMFRGGVDGQEIDLTATDHTSVLVREALYEEIARLRRRRMGSS